MSFKPMFQFGPNETKGNAQAFATYDEAAASAAARFMVWTMPTGFEVQESDERMNYRWDDDAGDVPINRESDNE